MNLSAHMFNICFNSLGYIPRSGIAGSYGRKLHFMFRFWNFFSGSPMWESSRHELGPWASSSTSDWRPFSGRVVKLKARSLCVGPLPDGIDHVTLPLVFPARSVVRVGSLQPDPQLHSTAAHWGHILKLRPWSWAWTFSPSRTSEPSAARSCVMPI